MSSRLEFTKQTKQAAFKRSGGVCECGRVPMLRRPEGCGVKLIDNGSFFEHVTQAAIKDDASIENCACLVRTCWREKTYRIDLPVVAKSNRVRNKARGIRKPSRMFGSRNSLWKKKIGGEVVRRRK